MKIGQPLANPRWGHNHKESRDICRQCCMNGAWRGKCKRCRFHRIHWYMQVVSHERRMMGHQASSHHITQGQKCKCNRVTRSAPFPCTLHEHKMCDGVGDIITQANPKEQTTSART